MFADAVEASASQSCPPPAPLVSVAVTLAPGATLVALTVSTGGGVALNVVTFDVPPPGDGDTTVTDACPTAPMSAASMAARNCVALTKVVARVAPFHFTTLDATNPVPLTVNVKPGLPAGIVAGASDVIVGPGFSAASTVTVALVAARV